MPTAGEAYCGGMLVRVVCDGEHPFVAGLIVDRETERVVFAAPILRHLTGQHRDKLRQGFVRLGWRATIVQRSCTDRAGIVRTIVQEEDADGGEHVQATPHAGAAEAPHRAA